MVGGRINKPKTAFCKVDARKSRRRNAGKKKASLRSEETVSSTTEDVLRQCRTNPKANVKLSGKKKRLLLKEAKRLVTEKNQMEDDRSSVSQKVEHVQKVAANDNMDTS